MSTPSCPILSKSEIPVTRGGEGHLAPNPSKCTTFFQRHPYRLLVKMAA